MGELQTSEASDQIFTNGK